jgi:hypothetical protein
VLYDNEEFPKYFPVELPRCRCVLVYTELSDQEKHLLELDEKYGEILKGFVKPE